MRKIIFLFLFLVLGMSGWYIWQNTEYFSQIASSSLPPVEFNTLEIRYSPEEIMQMHKNELLKNSSYAFLDPKLLFYPYVMMEVKYNMKSNSTGEGILLWSLNDGEMVINTGSWETTHGFEDCLIAKADKNDFKIIEVLAEHGGIVDREKLYHLLNVDQETIDQWIDSCRQKKLVTISGNKFRLHFQNPRLRTDPITIFDQPLVAFPSKKAHKLKGSYSVAQIKKLSQIAFGHDFAIRGTQDIFLPVYAISVQNPDGTILTTYWNCLNGKKIYSGLNLQ